MRVISKIAYAVRGYDWILTSAVALLILIGFAAIYSVDRSRGDILVFSSTQFIAAGIGIIAAAMAARLHVSFFEAMTRPAYLLSILLLLIVLFFGVTIRGTTGWFRFGAYSFQPAEVGKAALVLALALVVARQGRRFDVAGFTIRSGVISLLPTALVFFQPDLGSALVFIAIWFGVILIAGVKKTQFLAILGAAALLFTVAWFFVFKDYQQERLLTFLRPSVSPLRAGYNVAQSIIAVGAGQILGRGLGFGSQSQLHFLPEAQTDFIFAVIAEELGFAGAIVVMILYGIVLWRLTRIARQSDSDFGAYTVLGIGLMFGIHIILNIGAATGLLPVTGLTLPFLSYGGSSLIVTITLIGVAQSIAQSSFANRQEAMLYG